MKRIFLIVFALLLLSSCGAGEEETVSEETETLSFPVDTLEITGYIGEELGDSTNTFGILADAEYHLNTGNILLLDVGASCVKEFTPSGEYVRQISRSGSGPGELGGMSFEFFQMGGDLLVLSAMKQGFVVFDDSLAYKEEILNWTQNPPMLSSAISDTTFVCHKIDFTAGDNNDFTIYRRLALFEYGAEEYHQVFWEDSIQLSMNDLISNSSMLINDLLFGLTVTSNSELVVFALRETENYNVQAWNVDGTEAFSINLPLEPVAKSLEEIADEKAYMEGFFQGMGADGMGDFEPNPYRDMIVQVAFGPDGSIWVQRGTMDQPFFDIYNTEGTLIGHKILPETGRSWQFSISSIGVLAWEDDPVLGYQQLFIVQ